MESDQKTKLSSKYQTVTPSLNRLLPWLVAVIGSALTVFIWYRLTSHAHPQRFFVASFDAALPWISLVVGISVALLCAVAIRLSQITRERSSSLNLIELDYQKALAERIEAEESKKKLEIALLQGQKLQAIGTLAGGIAHDFNNILYAIIGYVEMAREDVPEDTLVHKNLGKVLEAARRGQDLVSRILTFGRRHQHHVYKPLQMEAILESVLSLLRPAIPSSVTISLNGLTHHYPILGDQTQLHQVFVNIINNAVDAMEGEGTVTINFSQIMANDNYLKQFPNLTNANYYKIDISDTGHGMDLSTIERIFEPFYTTKEVGKGTGLGLSMVHAIIKEHQGDVVVKSQLGKGSTFTLILPEHQPKSVEMENSRGDYTFSRRR